MNVKTLATIVGTLSLGSLATGCATTHPPAQSSTEKGTQGSCSGRGVESSCSGKGAESSCSGKASQKTDNDSQDGDRKAAAPEKGSQGACGENGCAGGR